MSTPNGKMSLPPLAKKQKLLEKLRKLKIQRDKLESTTKKLESTIEVVEGKLEALAIKMQKIKARHDAKKQEVKARKEAEEREAAREEATARMEKNRATFLTSLRDSGLPSKLVTSCYNKMSAMETAVIKNLKNISWEFHEVKNYIKTYGFCHVFCPRGKYYDRSRKITKDNPELQKLANTYETMCEHLHKWGPLQTVSANTFVIFENNPLFATLGTAERRRNHPFFFLKATGKSKGDIAATTKAQSHALLLAKKKELKTWTAQAVKSAKKIMAFIQGRVKAEQTYYDKLYKTAYHSDILCAAGVSSAQKKEGQGLKWLGEGLRRKLQDFRNDLTEDIKDEYYIHTLPPPPKDDDWSGYPNLENTDFNYWMSAFLTHTQTGTVNADGAGILNQAKNNEHVRIDEVPIWHPRDIQNSTWWVGG